MLTVAIVAKSLAEIALLVLLAQALVGLFAGPHKDRNPVYRLLQLLGRPWTRAARLLSPRVVLDRHLPLVAVGLLATVWIVSALAKVSLCLQMGVALCR